MLIYVWISIRWRSSSFRQLVEEKHKFSRCCKVWDCPQDKGRGCVKWEMKDKWIVQGEKLEVACCCASQLKLQPRGWGKHDRISGTCRTWYLEGIEKWNHSYLPQKAIYRRRMALRPTLNGRGCFSWLDTEFHDYQKGSIVVFEVILIDRWDTDGLNTVVRGLFGLPMLADQLSCTINVMSQISSPFFGGISNSTWCFLDSERPECEALLLIRRQPHDVCCFRYLFRLTSTPSTFTWISVTQTWFNNLDILLSKVIRVGVCV